MVSTEEERLILGFLQSCPNACFSAMEICRRSAHRRRYEEDPRWALPYLGRLVTMRLIERDAEGHYRCAGSGGQGGDGGKA